MTGERERLITPCGITVISSGGASGAGGTGGGRFDQSGKEYEPSNRMET